MALLLMGSAFSRIVRKRERVWSALREAGVMDIPLTDVVMTSELVWAQIRLPGLRRGDF